MSVHNLDKYWNHKCEEVTGEAVKKAKLVIVAFIASWAGGAIKFKVNLKNALAEVNKEAKEGEGNKVEVVLVCAEELLEPLQK